MPRRKRTEPIEGPQEQAVPLTEAMLDGLCSLNQAGHEVSLVMSTIDTYQKELAMAKVGLRLAPLGGIDKHPNHIREDIRKLSERLAVLKGTRMELEELGGQPLPEPSDLTVVEAAPGRKARG